MGCHYSRSQEIGDFVACPHFCFALAFGPCREELECLTGRSVDLINLRETNTVLQNEIITEGRLIYLSDESGKDAFEMNVMSAYQKLNEERAGILEEIESSGKVFK